MSFRTGKHTAGHTVFGRSDKKTFAIADGQQTRVDEVNLGQNYGWIRVFCDDCTGIQDQSTLSALVASDAVGVLNSLWADNGSAVWASGALPTTGGFDFMLSHANGIQRIRLALSAAADGADVILQVYGFNAGVP